MALIFTNYYFTKEVLSELEDKYKQMYNNNETKILLYSNFYNLSLYYTLNTLIKKDKFNLSDKLHNYKTKEYINELINYIRNNSFDKDNVFFLYCIICHFVLDLIINPYINSLVKTINKDNNTKNNNLVFYNTALAIDDLVVKEKEGNSLDKTDIIKNHKNSFIFNYQDLAIIKTTVNNIYFFSKADEYYKRCLKNFKMYYKNKKISLFKIKNKVSYIISKDKYIPSSFKINYDLTIDYLNNSHTVWINELTNVASNQSFHELYIVAKKVASEYLQAINNYLFYNNDKLFKNLFKNR